jgi:hypothetical protein
MAPASKLDSIDLAHYTPDEQAIIRFLQATRPDLYGGYLVKLGYDQMAAKSQPGVAGGRETAIRFTALCGRAALP